MMNKQEKPSYLKYAKDLLNNFVDPIIDDIRHDDYSGNDRLIPIQMVFPTKKLEKDEYGDYSIFTIFNAGNLDDLYNLNGDDNLTVNLPGTYEHDLSFCFSHVDSNYGNYGDDSWERLFVYRMNDSFTKEDYDTSYSAYGKYFVLSKLPEPSSFKDTAEIVTVLKQLMLERYATVAGIDVFTKEQFHVFQAKMLKHKLMEFCKEYGISKGELD